MEQQSTAIKDLPFKQQNVPPQGNPQRPMSPPTPMSNPQNPMGMAAGQGPPQPLNTAKDAASKFAQMPQGGPGMPPPGVLQKPMVPPGAQIPQRPGGPGQGISSPLKPNSGKKKEFFGLAESDYKSTVVVFALVLIFSSSIFFDCIKKYIPIVSSEGKTSLIGSLIAALLASVIFIVIKIIAKI